MARFNTYREASDWISQGHSANITTLTEFQLASGTMYVWPGRSKLTLDGRTWEPVGNQIQFSSFAMSNEETAPSASVSSIPKDMEFAKFIAENYEDEARNRSVVRRFSMFDEQWEPLIDRTWAIFTGLMDQWSYEQSAGQASITISLESPFTTQKKPQLDFYTDWHLRQRYPDARGLEFHSGILDTEVIWPYYAA